VPYKRGIISSISRDLGFQAGDLADIRVSILHGTVSPTTDGTACWEATLGWVSITNRARNRRG
jgi:hypothetical protein